MLRFIYVIAGSLYKIPYYIFQMRKYYRNQGQYSEETCYQLALKVMQLIKKKGRIETRVTGTENLPEEGGYIMYANHQGKYDALGIMLSHKKPCTFIISKKRSQPAVTTQLVDLIRAKRLDFDDMRQQVSVMKEVTEEVAAGRRYLIFPEGGYGENHNRLQEFKTGSFKCAERAKCPIIPVALYDSYKPFGVNSLKRVRTQVHFLKAIPYEEYRGLKTAGIRDMVVERIQEHILRIERSCREAENISQPWPGEESCEEEMIKEHYS
ncbi:lysophospholipid acyltransferase family protein [Anaerotaenia torta]|uniref:lysophospholipid acyltransferase family protein n=1 Tax=Anaerotaenia torta TaxID=433293 RepID=UPI003D24E414